MATRSDLEGWVLEALRAYGGTASIVQVARFIWQHYEQQLREAGDLFYTWQYDLRWAAQRLRWSGKLAPADSVPKGIWSLRS